jgi:hypothetical protein
VMILSRLAATCRFISATRAWPACVTTQSGPVTCWPCGGLEAVPAPHQQGGAVSRTCHLAEGAEEAAPGVLTVAETQAVLDTCTRLRDRFFFVLHETGCRAGGALGYEDIAAAESEVSIVPRENANGRRPSPAAGRSPSGRT